MSMMLERTEVERRVAGFYGAMNSAYPQWDTAVIAGGVNQYYFTGTMQDGLLVFKSGGEYKYFVRKSYERALEQSVLPEDKIVEMSGYKDIAELFGADFKNLFIEEDVMPYSMYARLKKYVSIGSVSGLDALVKTLRSVKSEYELSCMRECGRLHDSVMSDIVPKILREGMTEAEFAADIFHEMLKAGHHGFSRFSAFQIEVLAGQFAFGDGALVTSAFNGPAGMRPYSPAVQGYAGRGRRLKKGDLVFADISFGYEGYHTDKTQIYIYKGKAADEVRAAHKTCMAILDSLSSALVPGGIPSEIYARTLNGLPEGFKKGFMGKSEVKFLGHGVGLVVDEYPVIAKGFDMPLRENMTIALEPKKALDGIGLVGVEETFVVKPGGAVALTGGAKDIIEI